MGEHDINAFLGAGTVFRGRLTFEGVVRVDGTFEGEIASQGVLVVGRGGRVSGRLTLGQLRCDGLVEADVIADNRVVVHGAGRLVGTVCCPRLVVEEGGRLDGEVTMVAEDPQAAGAPGPKALAARSDEPPSP